MLSVTKTTRDRLILYDIAIEIKCIFMYNKPMNKHFNVTLDEDEVIKLKLKLIVRRMSLSKWIRKQVEKANKG